MSITANDNLSSLHRMGRQISNSRFMRWWVGELQSLIPAWLRPGKTNLDRVPRQSIDDIDSVLSAPKTTGTPAELVLSVPATKALCRTVRLPLATEENLSQVLAFQMEQYTPFSAAHLYFAHEVVARDFAKGQLEVALTAVQRSLIDGVLKKLRDAGYIPVAVRVLDSEGVALPHNLLPDHAKPQVSVWKKEPLVWLAALVLILVVGALALPLFIQREAAIRMIPHVERAKKAAEAVDGVRREVDFRIAQHNYLLEKRLAIPTTIQALEELTRVLPDDTWVQTLDWKGKEILIQGETASSVKLVGLFEQSSMFKDASFRSPLTKGQTPGTEHFSMALQLRSPVPAGSLASMPASPLPNASGVVAQ